MRRRAYAFQRLGTYRGTGRCYDGKVVSKMVQKCLFVSLTLEISLGIREDPVAFIVVVTCGTACFATILRELYSRRTRKTRSGLSRITPRLSSGTRDSFEKTIVANGETCCYQCCAQMGFIQMVPPYIHVWVCSAYQTNPEHQLSNS